MKMKYVIPSLFVILSPAAMAHPGHLGSHGFESGVLHPLTGLDHLSVMLGVGILAALFGGSSRWSMPVAFVALMIAGSVLGLSGIMVPGVELFIALSVVVMGAMLLRGARMPQKLAQGLVMAFAVFHGMAHGAEMPMNAQVLNYFGGFVLSTASLHLAGIAIGECGLRISADGRLAKLIGALMALLGGSLLFS